ncbi:MAG TPA: hypothetical protein VHJ17_20760 [Thermomonospora sp.]|nr:hypothetical protein [Thermomonospora sp.]
MGFAKLLAAVAIPGAALAALTVPGTAAADPLPGEFAFTDETAFARITGYKSQNGVRATLTDKGGDGRATTWLIYWYEGSGTSYTLRDTDTVTVGNGGTVNIVEYPDVNGVSFTAAWHLHGLRPS